MPNVNFPHPFFISQKGKRNFIPSHHFDTFVYMIRRKLLSKILIHLFVWTVLLSMPYLLSMGSDTPNFERIIKYNWLPLFLFAIVFYVNYLILIDRYLFQKKIILFLLYNALLFALTVIFRQMVLVELLERFHIYYQPTQRPSQSLIIYLNTLSLFVPLIFSISLKMGERWSNVEAQRKEVENNKLQSEIQHLKYQLQPHFFFNSLNNIYSLVDLAPDKAKATLHSLGKLMRYLLYESNTEVVELRKEIEFLEKYIDLMNLRTAENVVVTKDFESVGKDIKVAPLLFISLIENAYKHGISATEISNINFHLSEENGVVKFQSTNSNFAKNADDKSGSGIGLENLQKRLRLLYPSKHQFNIHSTEQAFSVELEIDTQA
jgi:sensor histidine kinase YesM